MCCDGVMCCDGDMEHRVCCDGVVEQRVCYLLLQYFFILNESVILLYVNCANEAKCSGVAGPRCFACHSA